MVGPPLAPPGGARAGLPGPRPPPPALCPVHVWFEGTDTAQDRPAYGSSHGRHLPPPNVFIISLLPYLTFHSCSPQTPDREKRTAYSPLPTTAPMLPIYRLPIAHFSLRSVCCFTCVLLSPEHEFHERKDEGFAAAPSTVPGSGAKERKGARRIPAAPMTLGFLLPLPSL